MQKDLTQKAGSLKVYSNNKMLQLVQQNAVMVVRIQTFVRKAMSRKQFKRMIEQRDMYKRHARYFTREEIFETVSKSESLGPVRRTDHAYENGGVYSGEWRGGFRHGTGSMVWPDGASYHG